MAHGRACGVMPFSLVIPGSLWSLVLQHGDETVTLLPERTRILLIVLDIVLLAIGLGLAFWSRQREMRTLRRQVELLEMGKDRARLEYQALEQRYDSLSRAAGDAFVIVDADGKVVDTSVGTLPPYGRARDSLLGLSLHDLAASGEAAALLAHMSSAQADRPLVWQGEQRRSDGTTFPAELRIYPLEVDGSRRYQVAVRDVSERVQAASERAQLQRTLATSSGEIKALKTALDKQSAEADRLGASVRVLHDEVNLHKKAQSVAEQERDMVAAILHSAAALVMVLDAQGRIVRFNRACENLTGRTADEVAGRPAWELPGTEAPDAAKAAIEGLAAGIDCRYEGVYLAPDGRPHYIDWCATRLAGAGMSQHVVAVGMDMTERRLAEQARAHSLEQQLDAEKARHREVEETARTRACRQAALQHLARRLLDKATLPEILKEALARTVEGLGVECCQVIEILPDGHTMRLRAGMERREGQSERLVLDPSAGTAPLAPEGGVRCGLSVTVGDRDRPFGTLAAHSERPRTFDEDDMQFLHGVADLLGLAVRQRPDQ